MNSNGQVTRTIFKSNCNNFPIYVVLIKIFYKLKV